MSARILAFASPPARPTAPDRARLMRFRARLETAIAMGIDLLDALDADLDGLEDDEHEIYLVDDR